jgi:putative addiction module component (TIGR02574 family)
MSDLARLTREALALPLKERIQLAQELWDSIGAPESTNANDDEAETLRLADERYAELASGAVEGIPHDEVMEKVRQMLRKK